MGLSVLGIIAGYEKVLSTFAEYVQRLHEVTEKICITMIVIFAQAFFLNDSEPTQYCEVYIAR